MILIHLCYDVPNKSKGRDTVKLRFVLAPDSFKGTLDALQICDIQEKIILAQIPDAEVKLLPMSDGGEGMVNSYHRMMGGDLIDAAVSGPLGEKVSAAYLMLSDRTAVIEMSSAAGLPMVEGREDPFNTTTFGVGELLLDAKRRGAKAILLGIGGSCTNDCGIGIASALGYRFFDHAGSEVAPLAKNLSAIASIAAPDATFGIPLRVACDVDNPLLGENGATRTFGPQKGASPQTVEILESGMAQFARILSAYCGIPDLASIPGAGAAGGMGAACMAFWGGKLVPGAELLLETAQFDLMLQNTDYVFTGEGRIDWQSAHGKVIGTIAAHCKTAGVPCIALCGSIGNKAEELYDCGVSAIFSTTPAPRTFEEVKCTAAHDLAQLTDAVVRLIR